MQSENAIIPASGALPDHYQEVLYWKLSGKPGRVILMNLLAIPLFVLSGLLFYYAAIGPGKLPVRLEFGLGEIGLFLAGIVLTLVLHELTHGLVMTIFGAKPQYGVMWKQMMFYATSPGYAYRRNHYLLIALAPLVILSLLALLGMWLLGGTSWVALLGICAAINASGAIGDLWISAIVLRYATRACVMDERDGLRVFLPKPLTPPTPGSIE